MSVRHAMLALLSEGPKYGLQLREEFEARTGEVWPLNVGQVYTTLQRLERDGLVESGGAGEEGPQKGFRFRLDSVVRWLDAAEARVKRAAADGAMTWADRASPRNPTRAPLPRHRREARLRG